MLSWAYTRPEGEAETSSPRVPSPTTPKRISTLPGRRNLECSGRRGGQTQPRQGRHLPGERLGLRRLLPEAVMCTTNNNNVRFLRRGPGEEYVDLLRAYMETELYQKALRKRKVWIKPLFAEGKLWHGMGRFRMRTLKKVNTEALITAAAQNIKRLLAFGGSAPKKLKQAAALRPPGRLLPDLAHRRFRDHRRKRGIDPTLFNKLVRFCYTPSPSTSSLAALAQSRVAYLSSWAGDSLSCCPDNRNRGATASAW